MMGAEKLFVARVGKNTIFGRAGNKYRFRSKILTPAAHLKH
jgi:hypothetical protein